MSVGSRAKAGVEALVLMAEALGGLMLLIEDGVLCLAFELGIMAELADFGDEDDAGH